MQHSIGKRYKSFSKILIVITDLDYGGAEIQVVNLAIEYAALGYKVCVLSMMNPVAFSEKLEDHNVKVKTLNMTRGKPSIRALFKFYRILNGFAPDIVHSHMIHANLLARIGVFGRRRKLISISTAHSIFEGGKSADLMYRFTDFLCDHTTNVSVAGTKKYIEHKAFKNRKTSTVYNGIDTNLFIFSEKTEAQSRKSWLAVGRFEEAKDYQNMLRAWAIIIEEFEDIKLSIIGDGSERKEIENTIIELKLSKNVTLLGKRDQVNILMQNHDAYIMSSAWEGLPIVLLEAMSSGLPIVTTDVGGNREIIVDGINGYCVEPKNSDALAQATLQLMQESDQFWRNIKNKNRDDATKKFDIHIIVDTWLDKYEELYRNKFLNK